MLRLIFLPLLLASCSLGVVKTGGDRAYIYDVNSEYTSDELQHLAPEVVATSERDPQLGKHVDLFSKKMPPLKRVGVMIFETVIQPTRSGLSDHNKVYLKESGKQLLTEDFLSIWEESFPILGQGVDFIRSGKIKASVAFKNNGGDVEDYILSKRNSIAPDDIFYLAAGKNTPMVTTLNPRGMKDFSMALVPAGELMMGPKFSEHQKHAVNELAKELNLDAVFLIFSEVSWSAAHTDKHSGEFIPEEILMKIKASTLVPFGQYHARLEKLEVKGEYPKTTVAFKTYDASLEIPVLLSVGPDQENFATIETELLNPMMKAYKDLSQMVMSRMVSDLKGTY